MSSNTSEVEETVTEYNLITAAKVAGVTPGTIRYWILTGRLVADQDGAYWSIQPEELELAMSRKKETRKAEAAKDKESDQSTPNAQTEDVPVDGEEDSSTGDM